MTHHGPSQIEASCPLRSRSPCRARSHPSILPCSILSASLRSALRLPFGLPSLPPFGACLRFGGLSSPNLKTGCASRHTRSMAMCEIQTFSPLFFVSSPGDASTIPNSSPIARLPTGVSTGVRVDVSSNHRHTSSGLFASDVREEGAHSGPGRHGRGRSRYCASGSARPACISRHPDGPSRGALGRVVLGAASEPRPPQPYGEQRQHRGEPAPAVSRWLKLTSRSGLCGNPGAPQRDWGRAGDG